jgi:hypothetical protein
MGAVGKFGEANAVYVDHPLGQPASFPGGYHPVGGAI